MPLGPAVVVATLAVLIAFEPRQPAAGRPPRRRLPGRRGRRRPDPRRDRRRHDDHASLAPRLQVDRGLRLPPDPCRRDGPRGHRERPRRKLGRGTRRHLRFTLRGIDRRPLRRPSRSHRRPATLRRASRPLPGGPRPHHLHLPRSLRPRPTESDLGATSGGRASGGPVRRSAVGPAGGRPPDMAGNRERRRPRRRRSLPRDPDRGGRIRVVPWCVLSNAPVPGSTSVRPGAPC